MIIARVLKSTNGNKNVAEVQSFVLTGYCSFLGSPGREGGVKKQCNLKTKHIMLPFLFKNLQMVHAEPLKRNLQKGLLPVY